MKILKVFNFIFVREEQLEESIAFYEQLFGERNDLRFLYSEAGLELATVGSMLLAGGSEDAIASVKEMKLALIVDSLKGCKEELLKMGATNLSEVLECPTGYNLYARHPDGSLVEYIEWVDEKVAAINLIKTSF